MEVSGQLHASAASPGVRVPGTHWMGGRVDSRVGLEALARENIPNIAAAGN